jgi:FG-GAP-like repeat/Abnormal spindle-like microcephaly-assoc'd, ASPM-SPD-2-Hydin
MKSCFTMGAMGIAVLFLCAGAAAQTNAVPFLSQALSPASIAPGSKAFTLTVNGSGFASTALVNWSGATRLTEVISSSQLKATISASDVATAKTAWITVTNPAPGGGTSSVVLFPVTEPSSSIGMAITQAFPNAVAVGDFNNDGKLDVAWIGTNSLGDLVLNVSLGNGKGGFQAPVSNGLAWGASQTLTGDFNGDGKLDLAGIGSGNLIVLLGNGDGTFTESFNEFVFNGGIEGLATADFNQDGHLDIYVGGWETGPMYFDIYSGNGDGTFSGGGGYQIGGYPVWGIYPGTAAIGDFNRDGYLDLAIGGNGVQGGSEVEIWLGGPGGVFTELGVVQNAYGVNVTAADLNGDGKLDLVTDTGSVCLGNGDGTFSPCTGLPYYAGEIAGIGDFNGDGKLDVVTGATDFTSLGLAIEVNLGAGDGTFPNYFTFAAGPAPGGSRGAIGDFNNDGKLDVISPTGYLFVQTTVDLRPFSLTFGSQNVGTVSAPQTATLSNVGTSALGINRVGIAGIGSANFTQTNDCGSSLAAASSCAISVTFAPKSGGVFSPSLTVSYKGTASPQKVTLSGTGVTPPTVSLLPANLKFATQLVGTTSAPQTATLTNTGDQAVTISNITASGAFTETNNCPSILGVSGSCQIEVMFTPTTAGAASGSLSVTDNAANSPQKITLSGIGTVLTFSPVDVNFGNQKVGTTSAAAPVTLTNLGANPVAITLISITGTNAGDFSQINSCGKSLAANASCTINVKFKPTATGARSAAVTVTDGGGGSPQSVPLSGTGT